MKTQKTLAALLSFGMLASPLGAEVPAVERPSAPVVVRPYLPATVSPIRLKNSNRLYSLIRAGKLYLTVQDAIALAIENNLDLEVDRYGPLNAEWNVERAQAGGPLRGVNTGNNFVNTAVSGQGVVGSQVAAGLSSNGGNGNGGNGGAIISQIGPVTQNLDAVLRNTTFFSHTTTPQSNPVQSQTIALVDTSHVYDTFVQQGLISGGYVQVAANESYLKENAPTDFINPSVAPIVQVYIRHNFLNGFGTNVNSRFISVAKKNIDTARETFRSQLLNVVANVLNLYWDLVTDNDDLKVRQRAIDAAEKFYQDTKQEIDLGALAKVEIYRAEAELSKSRQQLAISQASVHQQENLLKDALSRTGIADPVLDAAEVVPLDHVQVPENEELPALRSLVTQALNNRPDIALATFSQQNAETLALGTANGILPTLQGITAISAAGLAGTPNPQAGQPPVPAYQGGLGTAVGQIFRHDAGSERAAVIFQGSIHNRVAQGDYGVDQLQLRQSELINRRNQNQLVVDISNQMVALRQARARYAQAVDTRNLQEQLLEKEGQKFLLGSSDISSVVTAQRNLTNAEAAQVTALSVYSHARVSLDLVIGDTLDRNHVSINDALQAHIDRPSRLPESAAQPVH
jgi:outer membrane protein TolC